MAVNRGNYFMSRETKLTTCKHGTGLSQFLKVKRVHPGVFVQGIRYIALGNFA